MKIKYNVSILNVISNLLLQFFTIISGFIIPRLILSYFGSEVNGLTSSLNQFLNYIALLEGGVTSVIMANLYKPLNEKNYDKVSSVVATTRKFYRRIGLIFCIYTMLLAILYPIIFKSEFNYLYVFSLTLILSINLFIQYNFSLTLKTLLNADKKGYIVAFTQIVIIIINIILAFLSLEVFPNIHFFKLVSGLAFCLQPIIYGYYVNKKYPIDKKAKNDSKLLKSRWDGFAINIAAFMHYNTDIAILTLFTNFKVVSVYSIYSLVSNGLRQLVFSISSGISPSIGHLYAKGDKDGLNLRFDLYEYIMFMIVFFLFSVAGLLITPFVMLYTRNVSDANYYQPIFGILILLAEGIYLIKEPHLNLAYSANKFKDMKKHAYIEAILNIIISVILVYKFKLLGVAIGTIIAMSYRTLFQVFYLKKSILNRKTFKFFKKVIIFGLTTFVGVLICKLLISPIKITITSWLSHAVIYSVIMFALYLIVSLIFYRKELKGLIKYVK